MSTDADIPRLHSNTKYVIGKGAIEKKKYKIISDYGCFAVSREVEAEDEDEAWLETGIMTDLIETGWTIESEPEGEEHTIIELPT